MVLEKEIPLSDSASTLMSNSLGNIARDKEAQPFSSPSPPSPPLSCTQSATSSSSQSQTTDGPPNGGRVAWLQVLGAFFLFFNSWGLINTFGVFQTFYSSSFLSNQTKSNIAWIGSIRAFMLLGSPILYGPVFDLGHPRLIVAFGAFLVGFGIMMTSLCDTLWQLILAQGICVGLGSGALFLTAVAIVPTYFTSKKSLAMGIAACGSSIGGVIYPIVFNRLLPQLEFDWAVRVLAFITLATNVVPICTIRMAAKPKERRAFVNFQLFKEASFDIWSLAWFFGNMGLYVPYFFIQDYAIEVVKQPWTTAFWTLTAINAASVPGRILPGLVADRINDPILVIAISTCCSTILSFCWIGIRHSIAGLFVYAGLYGFFSGAFVSLSTPGTVTLAPTIDGIGTRLGMFNFLGSLGLLVGNPAAGAISAISWPGMQAFCGCASGLSFILIVATSLYSRSRSRRVEASDAQSETSA